jgi:hypothetical protein
MACDTFTGVMLPLNPNPILALRLGRAQPRAALRETSVRAGKPAGKVFNSPCFIGLGAIPDASGTPKSYEDFMGFSGVFPLL